MSAYATIEAALAKGQRVRSVWLGCVGEVVQVVRDGHIKPFLLLRVDRNRDGITSAVASLPEERIWLHEQDGVLLVDHVRSRTRSRAMDDRELLERAAKERG